MQNQNLKNQNPIDKKDLVTAGLFNLKEFEGWPPRVVNNYFKEKGWNMIDCFNDYKWVWVNIFLNKSIVANIEMVDNDALDNEMIVDIWCYDGIYSE